LFSLVSRQHIPKFRASCQWRKRRLSHCICLPSASCHRRTTFRFNRVGRPGSADVPSAGWNSRSAHSPPADASAPKRWKNSCHVLISTVLRP
jgi:hypothetical protein